MKRAVDLRDIFVENLMALAFEVVPRCGHFIFKRFGLTGELQTYCPPVKDHS